MAKRKETAAEEKKPDKVNLDDAASLKRRLDEVAMEVITGSGYPEDHFVSNVKIVAGFSCIAFALLAQFHPSKYPDNFWLLLGCVAGYVVLSLGLHFFALYYEKDAFLFTTRPRVGSGEGLVVSSQLPRFSDMYHLAIAGRGAGAKKLVSLDRSVTNFFDVEGHCAEDAFRKEVEALLSRFEDKKSN